MIKIIYVKKSSNYFFLPHNRILLLNHKPTVLSLVNQSASFSLMLLTVNLEATPDNFLKSFQSNFIQFPKKEAPIILLFMAILLLSSSLL